ncbi:EPIDERMAL PATTERNING FACTOR-LIKE protein 1 [Zostera marina]|uniref:Epidermal patterning factor-like protein n=1 Tax=Zostera marina TaxID=29655 RepID=A0A0K9PHM6_ZOSMR|nr:EPIDERMAL PATTERNING FACTOR-LIKE protein 1 [Zostera marina]
MSKHLHTSVLLLLLLLLIDPMTPASASVQPHQGLLMEEDKIRLGSTPPSCHRRCDQCNPCIAVQVPTLPVAGLRRNTDSFRGYPNYKPLGWKCRCQGRFFNP